MPGALDEDYLPVPAPEPVLGLPDSVVTIGESVRQGRPLVVAVPVANQGGAGAPDLQVTLRSETHWVTTPTAPTLIPAGRTASITVTLTPPAGGPIGPLAVRLRVHAPNAVFDQEGAIEIHGVLIPDVALVADPPALRLGQVKVSDQPIAATLAVTRSDGVPARPVIARPAGDSEFAHSVTAVVGDDGRITVDVHTANLQPRSSGRWWWLSGARRREGAYQIELVIADQDRDVAEVRVPISLTLTDVPRLRCPATQEEEAPDVQGGFAVSLANVGGASLEVAIRTESRWLNLAPQSAVIRPGGCRDIRVSYDLASVDVIRPQATLEVESNDNGHPGSLRRMEVAIRRLWPELVGAVDPPQVEVRQERTAPMTLRLTNRGPGVAGVSVADLPAWLSLDKTNHRIEPGGTRDLRGRVLAQDRQPGPVTGKIILEYNGPPRDGAPKAQATRLAVPVAANVAAGAPRRSARWALALLLLPLAGVLAWVVLHPPWPSPAPSPVSPAPTPAPSPTIHDLALEARDAHLHGGLRVEQRGDYANIGFWTNATDWVSWTIDAPEPATYLVTAQCTAKAGQAALLVEVDGQTTFEGTVPQTASWEGFVPVTLGTVQLKTAGSHELAIRPRDAGTWKPVNLRAVRLSRR